MNIYINCNIISKSKIENVTQTIEATTQQNDDLIKLFLTQIIELREEVAFLRNYIVTEATTTEVTPQSSTEATT